MNRSLVAALAVALSLTLVSAAQAFWRPGKIINTVTQLVDQVVVAISPTRPSPAPTTPSPVTYSKQQINALADAILEQTGNGHPYNSEAGQWHFTAREFCELVLSAKARGKTSMNCLGQNPLTPYGLAFWENPDSPHIGDNTLVRWQDIEPGYDASWPVKGTLPTTNLRQDEAIVWVGLTPPRGRYWSINPYVASRQVPLNNWQPGRYLPGQLLEGVFPNVFNWWQDGTVFDQVDVVRDSLPGMVLGSSFRTGHRDILASFSESINVTNVTTVGDGVRTPIVAIFSPDQRTLDDTRRMVQQALAQLRANGVMAVDGNIINTVGLPAPNRTYLRETDGQRYDLGMRYGYGEQDDTFLLLFRTALPDDRKAANAWRAEAPGRVFKVRPSRARAHTPTDFSLRYTEQHQRAQGWDERPAYLQPLLTLRSVMATRLRKPGNLGGIYLRDWGNEILPFHLVTNQIGEGYRALHGLGGVVSWSSLGDSPDAIYGFTSAFRLPSDRHVAMFAGINHHYAMHHGQRKALYSSLTVMQENTGALAALTDRDLQGSARTFLSPAWRYPNQAYDEAVYVGFIANDCAKHPQLVPCRSVNVQDPTRPDRTLQNLGYSPGDKLRIAERIYNTRASGSAKNDLSELIPVQGVVFVRR